jgi:hypothetical protein
MSELKHINEKVNELLDRIADLKVEKQEMLDCLIEIEELICHMCDPEFICSGEQCEIKKRLRKMIEK